MSRTSRNALAVLATFLIGASTANLSGAAFSDDNWSNIGNIRKDAPLPHLSGGVDSLATDGSGNLYAGGDFTIASLGVSPGY